MTAISQLPTTSTTNPTDLLVSEQAGVTVVQTVAQILQTLPNVPSINASNMTVTWGGAATATLATLLGGGAPIALGSGSTAITLATGTDTNGVATTAFVQNTVANYATQAYVQAAVASGGQLPAPTTATANNFIAVNSGGTAYTLLTPAQVLSGIGAQATLGYTPAHSGTNGDITALTGLVTPLTVAQGGTGAGTASGALTALGAAALGSAQTFNGAQASTITPLTYAATIAPNLTLSNDFSVTLTGNATLANPSAMTPGTGGHIWVTQDSTGSRSLAYGSYYNFGANGAPTLSTTAGVSDVIAYWVASSTLIVCGIVKGV